MSTNFLGRCHFFAALSLGVAACSADNLPDNDDVEIESLSRTSKAEKTNQQSRYPKASETEPLAEFLPKELTVEELAGGWRVKNVSFLASRPELSDVKKLKGAIAEIYPESIRWSYKPAKSSGLEGFCSEPVAGIILKKAAAEKIKADFGPTIASLHLSGEMASFPHEWRCGGGGQFGPSDGQGADFMTLDRDHMLLRWTNDTFLYLERLKRPQPKTNIRSIDYLPDKNN